MIGILAAVALQTDAPVEWRTLQQDNIQVSEISYDVGISLTVGCREKQLIVAITGLSASPSESGFQKLEINIPDDELQTTNWRVLGQAMIAPAPAVYARRFRTADRLTIRLPAGGDGPPRRYELDLPHDHNGLDQTLEACDVPLVSGTDSAYDPSIAFVTWRIVPRVELPDRLPNGGSARALLECTVGAEGRPDDCRVLEETPANSGFARSALRSIRSGRLGLIDGGPPVVGGTFRTALSIRAQN